MITFYYRKEGIIFNTTAEFEVVKNIKEKICYFTSNSQRLVDIIRYFFNYNFHLNLEQWMTYQHLIMN